MSACKANVKQMTKAQLMEYYSARVNEWITSGRFPDEQAVVDKVNEELADFDAEGAWSARCGCGWVGNNPYPSKESAVGSLEYHYKTVREAADG